MEIIHGHGRRQTPRFRLKTVPIDRPFRLIAVSISCLLTLSIAFAGDRRTELDGLRAQIQETRSETTQLQADAKAAQESLREQELSLAAENSRLTEVQEAIQEQQKHLTDLQQQLAAEDSTLTTQRQWLAQTLRSQYIAGQQDPLRLILMQEDPHRIQRLSMYHQIVTRARVAAVRDAAGQIARLRMLAENTQLAAERLETLEKDRQGAIERIENTRRKRAETIAALESAIQKKNRELDTLRSSKRALEKLVYALPVAGDAPGSSRSADTLSLTGLNGKLRWPAAGRIIPSPGDSDDVAGKAVFIDAAGGSPVSSIANGVIRFADWFQGFGLLVIIDHGKGYMSLYGHNQSLKTGVGKSVKQGDVIAAVGDSGGQKHSGLYFAIRRNGKPENPSDWCQ